MNRVLCSGFTLLALLLAACGGGGGTSAPPAGSEPPPAALAASEPGALVEHVRGLLRARAQAGVSGNNLGSGTPVDDIVISSGAPSAPIVFSNTTVQELGVDEADLLKTDGSTIYALDTTARNASTGVLQLRLIVQQLAADGTLVPQQTIDLPADASTYPAARGLQFAAAANRLAVLTESNTPVGSPQPCPPDVVCIQPGLLIYPPQALSSRTHVQLLDRGVNGVTLGSRLSLDGRLVASRRVGNVLYLVTVYSPRLPVDLLPITTPSAEREAQLAKLTAAEVLPALRIDDSAPQPLVVDTDCYVQPRNSLLTLSITTITAIDLGSATGARASRCFAGGTEAIYMSPSTLYLATTRSGFRVENNRRIYAPQFSTDLHKFAFAGLSIDYRASGEVSGHLGWDPQRMSYRMGEHNGDLRVLSFTGTTGWITAADAGSTIAPSPATLTVLRERAADRSLQPVATLPNAQRPALLGKPGEQVYGVRLVGERGYLVTFRLTDPLYVLDLANAADPRIAGVLEVPGFSDYLFPLPDGLLFGVGKDADAQGLQRGVKVALFDVRDASQPKLVTAQSFGDRGSATALDSSPQGLNMLLQGASARIALPMRVVSGASFPGTVALHRFDVDTTARSLQQRAPIPSAASNVDLGSERSVQIGATVVYLNSGKLFAAPW